MTPQERQLIVDLFERLAELENQPRDPEAEQAIREGLAKAPHALYPLVQSVLVQDEALKAADAHIQELEAALQGGPGGQEQPKGFLDSMRDSLFGREEPRGSVPSVRPGEQPMGVPPQYRSGTGTPWGGGAPGGMAPGGMGPGGMGPGGMAPEPSGRGGSFLGTAAAAAAGAIGGGLLLNGIRGMLGGQQHRGPAAGAFDEIASGGSNSPWGGSGGGELSREAGLDDIGRGGSGRAGLFDASEQDAGYDRTAGLLDTDADDSDDTDFDDDDTDGGSDDTNYA
jgi:hypothetical protein